MNIQWYPGHMTKARRMMEENIKLIDLVMEIIDARIPVSSRNPDIDVLAKGKARMVILNKSDLAKEEITKQWEKYFTAQNITVVKMNSRSGNGMKTVQNAILEACREKIERDRKRGIINRPVRAMVVGIPNVGKSTFINTLAGKACTKTGNKPGVTKGKQWIRLNKNVELLDTPGILWPKFENKTVGEHLAMIGSVNDEILDTTELACELIKVLNRIDTQLLADRYEIETTGTPYEIIERIALARHCFMKGERADIAKAGNILLDEFRNGKLGKISLEFPTSEEVHG